MDSEVGTSRKLGYILADKNFNCDSRSNSILYLNEAFFENSLRNFNFFLQREILVKKDQIIFLDNLMKNHINKLGWNLIFFFTGVDATYFFYSKHTCREVFQRKLPWQLNVHEIRDIGNKEERPKSYRNENLLRKNLKAKKTNNSNCNVIAKIKLNILQTYVSNEKFDKYLVSKFLIYNGEINDCFIKEKLGHDQNVIKCSPKNVIIGIMSRIFKNRKRKGSFYKEIVLVTVESSNAAKLAAKKALSKQSKPVECSICGEFMKNEKEAFLITKYVIIDH
ncbi:hypothetical protein BpHYR1_042484 [Brachionus plicatilis]|uniref:Uncharacterized protein n=1 Tax=Brachionus plicatilis TaxID=10195 RepID=A0A3M7SX25_BRAPC|nr:hypothetical protein BpHYR1_042484 [Brachionus plicatilis]